MSIIGFIEEEIAKLTIDEIIRDKDKVIEKLASKGIYKPLAKKIVNGVYRVLREKYYERLRRLSQVSGEAIKFILSEFRVEIYCKSGSIYIFRTIDTRNIIELVPHIEFTPYIVGRIITPGKVNSFSLEVFDVFLITRDYIRCQPFFIRKVTDKVYELFNSNKEKWYLYSEEEVSHTIVFLDRLNGRLITYNTRKFLDLRAIKAEEFLDFLKKIDKDEYVKLVSEVM